MQFTAELQQSGKTATGIRVAADVIESLNAGKRVAVVVTIKKHSYRTTVAPYNGAYMIPVSAANREAAGVTAGEMLRVGIEVDEAPREIQVPVDLAAALKRSNAAKAFFDSLSFSNQRGYVTWVEDAKKQETRNARVAKCVESLEAGRKQH